MAILFLADNAGIGCANWVLRAITADMAPVLRRAGAAELAEWLLRGESPVELYGHLDVRDLSPENARIFVESVGPAYREARERGPLDWEDPSYWQGYMHLFGSLAEQAAQVARGETPTNLPNLRVVPPHDSRRSGPGWPSK